MSSDDCFQKPTLDIERHHLESVHPRKIQMKTTMTKKKTMIIWLLLPDPCIAGNGPRSYKRIEEESRRQNQDLCAIIWVNSKLILNFNIVFLIFVYTSKSQSALEPSTFKFLTLRNKQK